MMATNLYTWNSANSVLALAVTSLLMFLCMENGLSHRPAQTIMLSHLRWFKFLILKPEFINLTNYL